MAAKIVERVVLVNFLCLHVASPVEKCGSTTAAPSEPKHHIKGKIEELFQAPCQYKRQGLRHLVMQHTIM